MGVMARKREEKKPAGTWTARRKATKTFCESFGKQTHIHTQVGDTLVNNIFPTHQQYPRETFRGRESEKKAQ